MDSTVQNTISFQLLAVYQYYAEKPERYLYSTNPNIQDGWKQGPIAFYGLDRPARDIVPIYRFVATSPYYRYQYSSQFVTDGPGWINEGIAFYAANQPRHRYAPVYQYYAIEQGNWRYQYSIDLLQINPNSLVETARNCTKQQSDCIVTQSVCAGCDSAQPKF